MTPRLFGTDGIRGHAGTPPLDASTVARLGAALVRARGAAPPRVLIGRDSRESGPWIEEALARGLSSAGAAVSSVGLMPTPAVAYLTRARGFDLGIVISASHNPFEDNGIKVFSGAGEKYTEALERAVEAMVDDGSWAVPPDAPGHPERLDLATPYLEHLREILNDGGSLRGSRLSIDCANGATSALAPALFTALGFEVGAIGVTPDGRNINLRCGSTAMDVLAAHVTAHRARLGVAFDGDGDRALFVDHQGRVVDGDAVLLLCALQLKAEGRLPGDAVVATVMSNVGLELALREHGITLVRAAVGDKYVMEEMLKGGLALGGEQSGHVIFAEHLFTGDGLATALQVLRVMVRTGRELADLAGQLTSYPQVLVNVRVTERTDYHAVPQVADAIRRIEQRIDGQGRLLIRYSGTEPLLRIMIEGRDQGEIQHWADEIAAAVCAGMQGVRS
jgi:phosphoglucosamine mutase